MPHLLSFLESGEAWFGSSEIWRVAEGRRRSGGKT